VEIEAQNRSELQKDMKRRVSDRVALQSCVVDIICLARTMH